MASPTLADLSGPGDPIFGNLTHVKKTAFVSLGIMLREALWGVKTTRGSLLAVRSGSYNMVPILQLDNFKMVIRIPTCGQSGGLDPDARRWVYSHAQTLHYIKGKTKIPVPEIYHFDTTANNAIRAPYIAMSYIGGDTLTELWYKGDGHTPLEERRLRILRGLAELMPQLNKQRFDTIGSLVPSNNAKKSGFKMGPCFGWGRDRNGMLFIEATGPFKTTLRFMEEYLYPAHEKTDLSDGTKRILKTIMHMLPRESDFVLTPYDLDLQNVMADETGEITGIIDWDNAQTMPTFLGCLRYPEWLVRNRHQANEDEDAVVERRGYRAYYVQQVKKTLATQGRPADYRLTENSHVFDDFWLAMTYPKERTRICQGFVEQVKKKLAASEDPIPEGLGPDSLHILSEYGRRQLDHAATEALKRGLQAVFSLNPQPRRPRGLQAVFSLITRPRWPSTGVPRVCRPSSV